MAKILAPLVLLVLVGCQLMLHITGAATGGALGALGGPGAAAAGGAAGVTAAELTYQKYFADGSLPDDTDDLTWGEAKGILQGIQDAQAAKDKIKTYGGLAIAGALVLWLLKQERRLKSGAR